MTFKKPKWIRRIGAALLDFICAILLMLILSFATTPIVNKIFNGDELKNEYYSYAIATKLYEYDENNNIQVIYDVKTFDENLTYFYKNCTDNKIDEYINKKKESSLFHYDETTNSYVENEYDYNDSSIRVQYTNFYVEIRDYCIKNYLDAYLNKNENYKVVARKVSMLNYTSTLSAFVLSLIIIYLLIPLINKDNKTIGKMFFKLILISKVNIEIKPSKLQILFRQLVLILFEFIFSISFIGLIGFPIPIGLIASILLAIFTKYHQSLHDICSSTILIDDDYINKPIDEGDKYEITYYNLKEAK